MACKHCNLSRAAFYRGEDIDVEIGDYCVLFEEIIPPGSLRQRACPAYES